MSHPRMVSSADTGLLVVDVQDKLFHMVMNPAAVERDILFMLDVAAVLQLPVLATEQYPKGLGGTLPSVAAKLTGPTPEKLTFSCCGIPEVASFFRRQARPKLIVVGIETHVCVQQTALDLLLDGFTVFLAADAVSCRYRVDHDLALGRMQQAGAVVTSVEALAFELVGAAGTAQFKEVSKLVQERMKQLPPLSPSPAG
jgi:hypothetical protein